MKWKPTLKWASAGHSAKQDDKRWTCPSQWRPRLQKEMSGDPPNDGWTTSGRNRHKLVGNKRLLSEKKNIYTEYVCGEDV